MAYLSKSQYERRTENAAIRMAQNAEVSNTRTPKNYVTVTKCNMDSCVISCENIIMANLEKAGVMLAQAGIPCPALPSDESDYIDIDTIDLLYEIEDVPGDDEERQEWYVDNYSRIMSELSELNEQIEEYLRTIDEQHGTSYCPIEQRIIN